MSCAHCGATTLVAVLLPGHEQPEATVCLTCGRPQPVDLGVGRRADR